QSSSQSSSQSSDAKTRAGPDMEKRCADYRARLDRVQDQLRAGYREPRGGQLRKQRRDLQTAYRRDCV
ncbi:MAG: hypothetical protein RQ741_07340, partial [Wenzhouxiangellaceae bacterium]|nr:hypothetical protein [Wenzhouxiangellaceae bacterium]